MDIHSFDSFPEHILSNNCYAVIGAGDRNEKTGLLPSRVPEGDIRDTQG